MKLEVVKRYFQLLEQFSSLQADYDHVLHSEIEQTEFPNWITDCVTVSDHDIIFKRMSSGNKLLSSQKYDIQCAYESGDVLITEVIWTAVVSVDAGAFRAGQEMKAYFCCIFEFKDGLIYRQRNYDCFERF